MTRKDYLAIAAALAEADAMAQDKNLGGAEVRKGVFVAMTEISDVLAADNPLFDLNRFRAAIYPDGTTLSELGI